MTASLTALGENRPLPAWIMAGDPAATYDIAVLGGGLAGLCLAIQLRRQQPEASVAVFERGSLPAPAAAFKVGESSNEIAECYWNTVLGLGDLLAEHHVRKLGLRYFCPTATNERTAERVEIGSRTHMFSRTYQLDRGQFENELAERAASLGAEIFDSCRVVEIELGRDGHRVAVERNGVHHTTVARWVVDASGRRGLLKKQLNLAEPIDHTVNAVWFRLREPIELDDFDDDADWRRRVPEAIRWTSTNHLLGRGYWVWLIPLSNGSISVGIVADPRCVPYAEFATFDKALAWLHAHEPAVASSVEARRGSLQDFHGLRQLAFSCRQVFSADRWALTGEAGVFLDPLYSPGSDFIALGNQFIADLIRRDLNGDPSFAERAAESSELFLRQFNNAIVSWREQYPLMGNPVVWPTKILWDTLVYFSMLGPNFIGGGTYDVDFMAAIRPVWQRFHRLNAHMQWFFRRWDQVAPDPEASGFLDMSNDTMRWFNAWLVAPTERADLAALLERNTDFMERLAVQLMACAAEATGIPVEAADVDPYVFGLGAKAPNREPSPYPHKLAAHPHPEMIPGLVQRIKSFIPSGEAAPLVGVAG
jgi:flavin-dependent dehydrogenase